MNKKRKTLGSNEIYRFISAWKQYVSHLRSKKQKITVLLSLQEKLFLEEDIKLDIYEIRTRIHNLSKRYRFERKNLQLYGNPSEWQYFNAVHDVLGNFKSSFSNQLFEYETEVPLTMPKSTSSAPEPSYPLESDISSSKPGLDTRRYKKEEASSTELVTLMEKSHDSFQHFLKKSINLDERKVIAMEKANSLLDNLIHINTKSY